MRGFATKIALLATALLTFFALNAGQALATHVACGETIRQDTTLDSDLIDCPGNGIVIGADNITLDLNGHTIDGAVGFGNNGVSNEPPPGIGHGHARLIVEGGEIREFGTGISSFGTDNRIQNLRLSANGHGIAAAFGALIQGNTITGSGRGIYFDGCDECRIEDNILSGNSHGIHFDGGSSRNLFRHNSLSNNRIGMFIIDSDDNRFVGNAVLNNHIEGFSSGGIRAISGDRNVFERNFISGHDDDGISLFEHSIDNRIRGNSISGNGGDGIVVHPPDSDTPPDNQIVGNSANGNGDDGIDLDSPGNNVARNSANNNGDLGIEAVAGTIDGGGNKAFGNGNPLQCLNVVCK